MLGLCNPVLQPLGDDVGAELGRLARLANRTPAYDAKGARLPFWTDFLCTPIGVVGGQVDSLELPVPSAACCGHNHRSLRRAVLAVLVDV